MPCDEINKWYVVHSMQTFGLAKALITFQWVVRMLCVCIYIYTCVCILKKNINITRVFMLIVYLECPWFARNNVLRRSSNTSFIQSRCGLRTPSSNSNFSLVSPSLSFGPSLSLNLCLFFTSALHDAALPAHEVSYFVTCVQLYTHAYIYIYIYVYIYMCVCVNARIHAGWKLHQQRWQFWVPLQSGLQHCYIKPELCKHQLQQWVPVDRQVCSHLGTAFTFTAIAHVGKYTSRCYDCCANKMLTVYSCLTGRHWRVPAKLNHLPLQARLHLPRFVSTSLLCELYMCMLMQQGLPGCSLGWTREFSKPCGCKCIFMLCTDVRITGISAFRLCTYMYV